MVTEAPKTGRQVDRREKQEPECKALFLIMSQLQPGALVSDNCTLGGSFPGQDDEWT